MQFVDFHCHLDLYPNFEKALKEREESKVYTLTVTTTPRAWPKNKELTFNQKYVRAALGFHPQLITQNYENELSLWEKYLPQAKYVGEIGIDAGKKFRHTLNLQIKILRQILELCAKEENKILTIHSIQSAELVLDQIEELLPATKGKVVLHWFTGSISEAKQAIEIGCYFSINPKMMATKKGRELLDFLPMDRILTETDGPFTGLQCSDLEGLVKTLAKNKNKSVGVMEKRIVSNFITLVK